MASKDSDTRKRGNRSGRQDAGSAKPPEETTKDTKPRRGDTRDEPSSSSGTDSVIVRPPGVNY